MCTDMLRKMPSLLIIFFKFAFRYQIDSESVRMLWVVLLMISSVATNITTRKDTMAVPCPTHLCRCDHKKHTAICSGRGRNISYIPELPIYIHSTRFERFYFPNISKELFSSMVRNEIINISIQDSGIQNIAASAFEHMNNLTGLNLSSNRNINVTSLKQSLYSLKNRNISFLAFEQMGWHDLSENIFTGVRRNIDFVSLDDNSFDHLPQQIFQGLQHLKKLNVRRNRLKSCEKSLLSLTSLISLDLSYNNIIDCKSNCLPKKLETLILKKNYMNFIPTFCSTNGMPYLPDLRNLDLSFNSIHYITNNSLHSLPSLVDLTLYRNEIGEIPSEVFARLTKLEYLNLGEMKLQVPRINQNAFAIPSLKVFDFVGNNVPFDHTRVAKNATLKYCSELVWLQLSNNHMPTSEKYLKIFLGELKKLKTLYLINVKWIRIPDKFFELVPSVNKVSLSNNKISKIHNDTFSYGNGSRIKELLLDVNAIVHIGEDTFTADFWQNIQKIYLSLNPYRCDCDLLWFRDKLRTSVAKFKQYPSLYRCSTPSERKGLELQSFNLTADDCKPKSELFTVLVSTSSICLAVVICVLTVYKGRWHIRYRQFGGHENRENN